MLTHGLKYIKGCMNATEVTAKLWTVLQIQGYIPNRFRFPWQQLYQLPLKEVKKMFKKVVRETLEEFPLTEEERKRQGHEALVTAYRDVSPDIITKIQQVYFNDFSIFDYSLEPPS